MPNITISIDEKLLKAGREYAKKHHTSVNALIRNLLEQSVKTDSTQWLDECFALMNRTNVCSKGKRWKRADLYDVIYLPRHQHSFFSKTAGRDRKEEELFSF